MTVALTGTGGLFTRLGKLIGGLNELNSYRGTTTIGARATAIQAQYESADQQIIDSLFSTRDAYRNVHGNWIQLLQTMASNTVIQMANDDTPLASLDLTTAWKLIASQMVTAAASIQQSVPAVAVSAGGSNVGNGPVIVTVFAVDGKKAEYLLAETLTATVTLDAVRGATSGREPLQVKGTLSQTTLTDWSWPKGSGSAQNFFAVDATTNNTTNLLANSDFETWTGVTPVASNWTIDVGSAGVTIAQETSPYTGTYDMGFIGNGSQLTSIYQQFGQSVTGASQTLKPSTVYAINLATKVSATPAAGVLEIALTDGSGTILNNDNGTACSFTVALTGETTSYAFHNAFVETPTALPATVRLRVRLSTALDNTKVVHIDHLAMQQATQVYTNGGTYGGFYIASFSGSIPYALNDTWTLTATNTQGNFQKGLWQIMNIPSIPVRIPTSNSPTVSDGLVS
jgi:hypothetical protein